MKKNLVQAYKQAPWRTQIQWIGIFLLVLVGIAVVAGVYLMISGRAAATGRRIQSLEAEISALEMEINDLKTQYAQVSSAKSLSERAEALNMTLLDPLKAMYIEVPGYVPPSQPALAPPPTVEDISTPVLLPEFTASLWDWLGLQVFIEPNLSAESTGSNGTVLISPSPTEVTP
jgi:cell division protein FtsL